MAYTLDWSAAGNNGVFAIVDGSETINVDIVTTANAEGRTANVISGGLPAETVLWVSSLRSEVHTTIGFDAAVDNISFEVFDIDSRAGGWDDKLTIIALDAAGNQVPVIFSDLDGVHSVANGNELNADGSDNGGVETSGAVDSVTVNIAGPVVSIEFIFDNGESMANSGMFGISDMVFEAAPDFIVEGTAGDDLIDVAYVGDIEGDRIDNNDHSDGSNDDSIVAGAGDDTIHAGAGNDTIDAGTGDDQIFDSAGDDSVLGGDGKDRFDYETISGNDTVVGGEVDDTTVTDSGDKLDFHENTDDLTVVFTGDEAGTVTDGTNTITFSEIEHIMGGQGADSIDASASSLDQILDGGEGSDTITGGSGDDIIAMGQTQDFSATDGDDDVLVLEDGFGNDSIEGYEAPMDNGDGTFSGHDQLDVTGLTDAGGALVDVDDVTVTDTNGDGTGDAILTFPNGESITLWGVTTSQVSSDDQLMAMGIPAAGPPLNYIVEGGAGGDLIDGTYAGDPEGDMIDNGDAVDGSDDDYVMAGAGNDTVLAGAGNDSVEGEDGNDSIDGGAGADTIRGGMGDDTVVGGAGDDSIVGNEGADSLSGGDGNDTVLGEDGDDTVIGGAGDDSIEGNHGDDLIYGGDGNDFLRGSFDNDTLYGGTGDDSIWGGYGDDLIVIENDFGNDTIEAEEAFETLGDTLDLSAVTDDLTVDLTSADPEAGSFTDGTSTATFVEIENIILGAGNDTLVLGSGSGADVVTGFGLPTDNGDGTFTGVDVLDVTALTDTNGATVNTDDVTVTDTNGNGTGDAILTFPSGESLTLVGVLSSDVSNPAVLNAMGIAVPNYVVNGTAGDDLIDGTYLTDPEGDVIDGLDDAAGTNNDSVVAGAGNDTVFSYAGDDTVEGGTGHDSIDGGDGDDVLIGGAGNDTLQGWFDDDSITGGGGADSLVGWTGDDTLAGGAGADSIAAGDGEDLIILEDGFGNDTIDGGDGGAIDNDTLDLSATTTGVTVDLTNSNPENGTVTDGTSTATFTDIETIVLGGGDDTIVLADGSGSDTVTAFEGPIDNGGGTFTGQDQIDVSGMTDLSGDPVDTGDVVVSDDGSGNAVLTFPNGESVTLLGIAPSALDSDEELEAIGIPPILLNYIVEGTAAGEMIDAAYTGDLEGDMIDNNDALDGSNDDYVIAGGGDDTIWAGGGDDTIWAGDGDDSVEAGDGDDLIVGGAGDNTIIGGAGNDVVFLGNGDDVVYAGAGDDTVNASLGADEIHGGAGNDVLTGGGFAATGHDTIFGDAGNDTIDGGFGNDSLDGGDGDDIIGGEVGDDIITGGAGNDTLVGGADQDTFHGVSIGDVIDGSETGLDNDTLDLSDHSNVPDFDHYQVTYDLVNTENGTVEYFDAASVSLGTTTFTNIENVICFVGGTRIATTLGEIAVENLKVGQMVQTMDHGLQPIRWIGSTTRRAVGNLAPVRIRKGALGNTRDLWVSPQHRMLLAGWQAEVLFGEREVLATAKSMINDETIVQVQGGEVEYFHILFDAHEIVFAEGAPSESFHPGVQSLEAIDEDTRAEILELFPELELDNCEGYGPAARASLKSFETRLLFDYGYFA